LSLPASAQLPGPTRVLVLTGGLIHLVHQLAVVRDLPAVEAGGATIAVLITGVLTRDPPALAALQAEMARWFAQLAAEDTHGFGGLRLLRDDGGLRRGEWDLACINSQWLLGQRTVVERLGIARLLVSGDGLGIYYRCARELRAVLPSLLGLPIPDPGVEVRYVLSGRQPRWHRPPFPADPAPDARRRQIFTTLVASQAASVRPVADLCLVAGTPGRPIWLCSVPNLAHQFPGDRLPIAVLHRWRRQLERRSGFDPTLDRLMLIDHPKAPSGGSFGADTRAEPWLAGPLRSAVPLEVLVRQLEGAVPARPIVVAGLTSALYGVRCLTGARVVWLALAPLWQANPHYRRRPLEFLHRLLRVRRMALLTAQLTPQ
jgi:hypothetical protein